MKILLTGASGFIGSKLLDYFNNNNYSVAIHTTKPLINLFENIISFTGDLSSVSNDIKLYNPNYVFHLAGSSISGINLVNQKVLLESNLLYGLALLDILKDQKELIFVNFNTSLAYRDTNLSPNNYYSMTKASFMLPLNYFTEFYSIRVFNLILYSVYGPGDKNKRAINYIVDSLGSKNSIAMSPGLQVLDFIHIYDVIRLCEEILHEKPIKPIEDIHVGSGRGTNLIEAAKLISTLCGQKTNIHFGAIPYRKEEKMVNIAPISQNRFWKSSVEIETGFLSLI